MSGLQNRLEIACLDVLRCEEIKNQDLPEVDLHGKDATNQVNQPVELRMKRPLNKGSCSEMRCVPNLRGLATTHSHSCSLRVLESARLIFSGSLLNEQTGGHVNG